MFIYVQQTSMLVKLVGVEVVVEAHGVLVAEVPQGERRSDLEQVTLRPYIHLLTFPQCCNLTMRVI